MKRLNSLQRVNVSSWCGQFGTKFQMHNLLFIFFLVLHIPGIILLLSALGGFRHFCSCNESSSAFAPTYFLWNIEKEIEAIFMASISILGGISEAHKTRGEIGMLKLVGICHTEVSF